MSELYTYSSWAEQKVAYISVVTQILRDLFTYLTGIVKFNRLSEELPLVSKFKKTKTSNMLIKLAKACMTR